jgi:hypothetical protein
MATLDARLARQAAAEKRLSAALSVIANQFDVEFNPITLPKTADENMRQVVIFEQFASWMELLVERLPDPTVKSSKK